MITANIYVYAGGRFHWVSIYGPDLAAREFYASNETLDQLMVEQSVDEISYREIHYGGQNP